MAFSDPQQGMNCREARLLASLYIEDDPSLTQGEREAFETHLLICPACCQESEEKKELFALVKAHWGPISEETRKLLEKGGYPVPGQEEAPPRRLRPMTVEESWEDLKRQSPGLAEACLRQEQKARRQAPLRWIVAAAVAASLMLAVVLGWKAVCNRGGDRSGRSDVVETLARAGLPETPFAEWVTASGRHGLPLGEAVEAALGPRELLLGGMHRVVMKPGVVATLIARGPSESETSTPGDVAYEVLLARGEIFVDVVPGHAFTVRTDNALLSVLGTQFNVIGKAGLTEITCLEGTVRFAAISNENQWVDVTAGYASLMQAFAPPLNPRKIDVAGDAAWAYEVVWTNLLANLDIQEDLHTLLLETCLEVPPGDLVSADYDRWLKAHEEWFARQFPWIFDVQEVLRSGHGLEADYIELLVISGDIRQFEYPGAAGRSIPVFNALAVERIA